MVRIGVYSGGLLSHESRRNLLEADISEIGIVWKKQALDDIVNGGCAVQL